MGSGLVENTSTNTRPRECKGTVVGARARRDDRVTNDTSLGRARPCGVAVARRCVDWRGPGPVHGGLPAVRGQQPFKSIRAFSASSLAQNFAAQRLHALGPAPVAELVCKKPPQPCTD